MICEQNKQCLGDIIFLFTSLFNDLTFIRREGVGRERERNKERKRKREKERKKERKKERDNERERESFLDKIQISKKNRSE